MFTFYFFVLLNILQSKMYALQKYICNILLCQMLQMYFCNKEKTQNFYPNLPDVAAIRKAA